MRKILFGLLALLGAGQAHAQFFPITAGAVPFGDSRRNLRADATNFFWDNSTKQVELGAGTAALPAYSFVGAGNTDNGLYRSGTDEISLSTAGAQRVVVTSAGSLLVGTALNPNAWKSRFLTSENAGATLFGVVNTNAGASASAAIRLENDTDVGGIILRNSSTNGAYAGASSLNLGTVTAASTSLITNNVARLLIDSDGNIATSSFDPTVNLHVSGGLALGPTGVSVTADNQAVTVGNASFLRISSDDGTATNRTITISNGLASGQILTFHGVAGAWEIADTGNVQLNSVFQSAASSTLMLQWDSSDSVWRELARSLN